MAEAAPELYWTIALCGRLENQAGQKEKAMASAKRALELAAAAEGQQAPAMQQDAETLKTEMKDW